MSVKEINQQNFEREVTQASMPVLVDFWAPWCGPCRMVSPIVEEVAREATDTKVCKVNVDENPELAKTYGVMSIPMLIVFKGGQVHKTSVGAIPKSEILKLFE